MIRTPKTESLVPPLTQGEITPLWQMVRLAHHPEPVEGEGRGEIF
jgi:hypothetical protein